MVATAAGGDGAVVMAGFTAEGNVYRQNWRWDAVAVKLDVNREQERMWQEKKNIPALPLGLAPIPHSHLKINQVAAFAQGTYIYANNYDT